MKRKPTGIFLAGALLLWAAALISQTQPASSAHSKSGGAAQAASMDRGKQVYLEQCLACHQADGSGIPDMNPPLIKTESVLGDKTALVRIVLNGMTGAVVVNGVAYRNVMAPHSNLTDQQIADVLTYVRNSFGNKATPVTPAEVKAIRAKPKK